MQRRAGALLVCALLVFLCGPASVRAADHVRVVETRTLAADELPRVDAATHDLALYLYAFRGTRWRANDIAPAITESARLLAQCGVALARAELRVLEGPRAYHFYFTPVSRELVRSSEVSKPSVFFVEDTRNRPAFDAEAIGLANATSRPELANTVWVAYGARDLPYALAHELVHVLSDSGEHSGEPGNLMRAETSAQNTRLSDAQCRRLRAHGEANGLLRRR